MVGFILYDVSFSEAEERRLLRKLYKKLGVGDSPIQNLAQPR